MLNDQAFHVDPTCTSDRVFQMASVNCIPNIYFPAAYDVLEMYLLADVAASDPSTDH